MRARICTEPSAPGSQHHQQQARQQLEGEATIRRARTRRPPCSATFVVKPTSTATAANGTSVLPLAASDAAEMAAACASAKPETAVASSSPRSPSQWVSAVEISERETDDQHEQQCRLRRERTTRRRIALRRFANAAQSEQPGVGSGSETRRDQRRQQRFERRHAHQADDDRQLHDGRDRRSRSAGDSAAMQLRMSSWCALPSRRSSQCSTRSPRTIRPAQVRPSRPSARTAM